MTRARTRLLPVLVGVAVVALIGGGAWWWRAATVRAAVVAVLPARPNLDGARASLVERIASAEQRARSVRGAVDGLAELARLYHANGFLSEAAQCERALVEFEPSNPRWLYLRAHTIGGYGNLDEALPMLRRTIELAPAYLPARIRLADALLKQNDLTGARLGYQEVLARDPHLGYAIVGMARADLVEGRPEAARQRLQDHVAARPQFVPAWTLLISVDEQLGDSDAAAGHRRQAPDTSRTYEMPDPWIDELMADCYDPYRLAVAAAAADPADDQARARQLLERATTIAPEDDLAFRLLGNLLADLGELAEARRNLERAATNDPENPDNWSYLIRVLKAMGDMPAANRALDSGLSHCPDAGVLHLENGRRLAAAGQLDTAAAAFMRSRRLRPEESTASMELARLYFRQNRLEDGVEELRNVVKIDPNHPVAVVLLARYAISTGDQARAAEWIARARSQPLVPARDIETVLQEYRERFGRTP